jgi:hypothetical protein
VVLFFAIVGLGIVSQHVPRAEIAAFPSFVTFPPHVAVVVDIKLIGAVTTVAITGIASGLT